MTNGPAVLLHALTHAEADCLHALARGDHASPALSSRLYTMGVVAVDQDDPHGGPFLTPLGCKIEALDRELRSLPDDFDTPDV